MKKIAVVHYMPIEYYPPTTNFLDILSEGHDFDIRVWSTHNTKNRKVYSNDSSSVFVRTALPAVTSNGLLRLMNYFIFNFKCLLGLLFFKPTKIVYFESFSVWPVYIYKKYFNRSVEIIIHYHEYFSPYWYENGMRLVKYYHKLESNFMYRKASWISQTNKDRMSLFLKDNVMINPSICRILPNYPPSNWFLGNGNKKVSKPIKSVYIGTLSLDYSYIEEYCNWVISKKGDILFDIYGYNYNEDTLNYLKSIESDYINFYESGIDYHHIPKILKAYDVGLILYKAITENFKYNAPNKLYEYLVCNLRVWYSDKMLGIDVYKGENVISVDFENIEHFNYEFILSSKSQSESHQFVANEALKPLIKSLKS
jgi:hypothetical protein